MYVNILAQISTNQKTNTFEVKWISLCEILADYLDTEGNAGNGFQYFPADKKDQSSFLWGPICFLMQNSEQ